MVEFVSWIGVVVIALFAAVGFTGVVASVVLTAVRALHRTAPAGHVEVRGQVAA
jgi:hypothetical protein